MIPGDGAAPRARPTLPHANWRELSSHVRFERCQRCWPTAPRPPPLPTGWALVRRASGDLAGSSRMALPAGPERGGTPGLFQQPAIRLAINNRKNHKTVCCARPSEAAAHPVGRPHAEARSGGVAGHPIPGSRACLTNGTRKQQSGRRKQTAGRRRQHIGLQRTAARHQRCGRAGARAQRSRLPNWL